MLRGHPHQPKHGLRHLAAESLFDGHVVSLLEFRKVTGKSSFVQPGLTQQVEEIVFLTTSKIALEARGLFRHAAGLP